MDKCCHLSREEVICREIDKQLKKDQENLRWELKLLLLDEILEIIFLYFSYILPWSELHLTLMMQALCLYYRRSQSALLFVYTFILIDLNLIIYYSFNSRNCHLNVCVRCYDE